MNIKIHTLKLDRLILIWYTSRIPIFTQTYTFNMVADRHRISRECLTSNVWCHAVPSDLCTDRSRTPTVVMAMVFPNGMNGRPLTTVQSDLRSVLQVGRHNAPESRSHTDLVVRSSWRHMESKIIYSILWGDGERVGWRAGRGRGCSSIPSMKEMSK